MSFGRQLERIREALTDTSPPRRTGKRKPGAVVGYQQRQARARQQATELHALADQTSKRPLLPPGRLR